jgi:GntR family transcriptional regulator, transcriptional repressor for pyruvate dehydrogenase complex
MRPQKTALIVAKRVVDDIHRSGKTVGDRLPPEKVMLETYEVGRGTLREALRYLELQGILTLKPGPGGGPVIETPDAAHLANSLLLLLQFTDAPFSMVVEARCDLEPIMARHAAERMTDVLMTRLSDSVDQMRSNLGDREVFLATNREFHEVIAWGSANSMYGFLIDALVGIVDGTRMGVDYPGERRKAILAAHERILTALLAHDGDASQAAMAEHMREFVKYMERRYADVLRRTVSWDTI